MLEKAKHQESWLKLHRWPSRQALSFMKLLGSRQAGPSGFLHVSKSHSARDAMPDRLKFSQAPATSAVSLLLTYLSQHSDLGTSTQLLMQTTRLEKPD